MEILSWDRTLPFISPRINLGPGSVPKEFRGEGFGNDRLTIPIRERVESGAITGKGHFAWAFAWAFGVRLALPRCRVERAHEGAHKVSGWKSSISSNLRSATSCPRIVKSAYMPRQEVSDRIWWSSLIWYSHVASYGSPVLISCSVRCYIRFLYETLDYIEVHLKWEDGVW